MFGENFNKQTDKNICSFCDENIVTVRDSNLCEVCISRVARMVNVDALYRVGGRVPMLGIEDDLIEDDTEVFDY